LIESDTLKNINNNRLSVQISLTGLSFLMTNSRNTEVLFFKDVSFDSDYNPSEILEEIKSILSEIEESDLDFTTLTLIYATGIYTLVPKKLFDQSKASEYLKFNSKILANDFIANDAINMLDIVNVYVPLINVNNYFFDNYGEFSYYHATTVLLKHILNDTLSIEKSVYINFQKDLIDILVFEDSRVVLSNSFIFKTSEDLIYYVLFTFEQLGIDPEKIKVKLMGNVKKDDPNYNILYKYIRNILFYKSDSKKITIAETEEHQNLILKYIA